MKLVVTIMSFATEIGTEARQLYYCKIFIIYTNMCYAIVQQCTYLYQCAMHISMLYHYT